MSEHNTPRKAVLFGISGLIGSCLAPLLSNEFDSVIAPVRRPHGTNDKNLQTPVLNFEQLSNEFSVFQNTEVLFYCLGTTRKKAGSFAKFQSIEWSLANQVLGMAQKFSIPKVVLLSSQGANDNSIIGYLKVKGDIERFASGLGFRTLIIARPSLLIGERSESRLLEGLSISLLKPVLKPLQKYLPRNAPIQDFELAQALLQASHFSKAGTHILENSDLIRLHNETSSKQKLLGS